MEAGKEIFTQSRLSLLGDAVILVFWNLYFYEKKKGMVGGEGN